MSRALTPLVPEADQPTVVRWLEDYLADHIGWWSEAYGMGWDAEQVAAHVHAHHEALVMRDWQSVLTAAQSEGGYVRVARDGGGTPLAVVQASVSPERFLIADFGALDWIYVDPEARGQGWATELLDAAMAWMRSRGARGAHVFVTAANPTAVRLYERAGFTPIDHRMLAPLAS